MDKNAKMINIHILDGKKFTFQICLKKRRLSDLRLRAHLREKSMQRAHFHCRGHTNFCQNEGTNSFFSVDGSRMQGTLSTRLASLLSNFIGRVHQYFAKQNFVKTSVCHSIDFVAHLPIVFEKMFVKLIDNETIPWGFGLNYDTFIVTRRIDSIGIQSQASRKGIIPGWKIIAINSERINERNRFVCERALLEGKQCVLTFEINVTNAIL